MKFKVFTLLILIALLALCGCREKNQAATAKETGKLKVITTLFPLYDFARIIGGDKADVTLLLPPGVEAHSFEPRPEDALKTAKSDLFIYTNRFMEPWAEKFVSGLGSKNLLIVDSSKGVKLLPAQRHAHEEGAGNTHGPEHSEKHEQTHEHHNHPAMDPHIWLDIDNALIITDNIASAMAAKDPANASSYNANAAALKKELSRLDADFKNGLATCKSHTLFHGGHYAFGYLANRYGLAYRSAVSVNADSEPTPQEIVTIIKQVKGSGAKFIFSEEMVSPRLTETIARETGTRIIPLHNIHNIARDDVQAGVGYITMMRKNLEGLRQGLECR